MGFGLAEWEPWVQAPMQGAIVPFLNLTTVSLAIGVSAWGLLYWLATRKGSRNEPSSRISPDQILDLITKAQLNDGSGLIVISPETRILAVCQMTLKRADGTESKDPAGLLLSEACNPRLTHLFFELIEQAKVSGKPAMTDIEDWTLYGALPLEHTRLVVSPSFAENGYRGALLVFRSLSEIKLLQSAALLAKQDFRVLFDNLPCAAAIFKPIPGAAPGTTEGLLLACNAPFRQLFEGVYEPPTTLADFVRMDFVRVPELRDGIAQLQAHGDRVRLQFFAPTVNRHVDVTLAWLPDDRFLTLVHDFTEQQLYADQVLQLNDQLRLQGAQQRSALSAGIAERDRFIEAAADQVACCVSRAGDGGSNDLAGLQALARQLVDYSATASLPYEQSDLICTQDLVQSLLSRYRERHAAVSWETARLPWLMASPTVLDEILRRLLDRLLLLPLQPTVESARIAVRGLSEFLTSGLRLEVAGLDATSLLLEVPEQMQPLDWTISSDLILATIRRMVTTHGGLLSVGPGPAGGFSIAFTLGTPTWMS